MKDAPITLDMKALEIKEPDHNALQDIYEQLEFRQLLKRTENGKRKTENGKVEAENNPSDFRLPTSDFRFKDGSIQGDLFSDIVSNTPVTTPSHTGEGQEGIHAVDEPPFILDGNTIIGHDLKAHWQELTAQYPEVQTVGLETDGVGEKQLFDTAIAHYLLHPEMRHGLDYLKDAYRKATLKELKELFEKELHDTGLWDIFRQMEMPLMCVLARMEQTGVRIDEPGLAETSRHFTEEMMHLEEEIYRLAGQKFNIASPRQVGEILFDVLQLDSKAKKTKTGQYVTGEEVLEGLRHKHEVVGKILEHRGLKKLLGTYIDALPKLVNTSTGHIHTTFNQTVTTTGRLSSSNPNLQNIPVRNAMGKEVRKAFIPDEGQLFFSADYSQIELRIMAHLSKDENLVQAFLCGEDIHAATAAKIFHKDISEVTSDERRRAKTANFGIIYGISAFGLSQRLEISRKEAKELIDGYFRSYPKVKEYMERVVAEAREKGYVETIFGRRRYLNDILSRNAVARGVAERNAVNAPIQGSAADIMKMAMVEVSRRFKAENIRSKVILQVHDELVIDLVREEQERVISIVREAMEGAASLKVVLTAEAGVGRNWLEAP